jgi:hypothetical protein
MMGMKEIIDGDVVKYLAETEKKLLLQPGIELAEYEGTL